MATRYRSTARDTLPPGLRRRYDYFRKQGYPGQRALDYARAELEAEDRGWEVRTQYEQERYEDVYGEKPPKGLDFVVVFLVDSKGEQLANLGFVPDRREDIREVGAELAMEALAESEPLFHGRRRR